MLGTKRSQGWLLVCLSRHGRGATITQVGVPRPTEKQHVHRATVAINRSVHTIPYRSAVQQQCSEGGRGKNMACALVRLVSTVTKVSSPMVVILTVFRHGSSKKLRPPSPCHTSRASSEDSVVLCWSFFPVVPSHLPPLPLPSPPFLAAFLLAVSSLWAHTQPARGQKHGSQGGGGSDTGENLPLSPFPDHKQRPVVWTSADLPLRYITGKCTLGVIA